MLNYIILIESLHEKTTLRMKNAFFGENQESVKEDRPKKGSKVIRRVPLLFASAIFVALHFLRENFFHLKGRFLMQRLNCVRLYISVTVNWTYIFDCTSWIVWPMGTPSTRPSSMALIHNDVISVAQLVTSYDNLGQNAAFLFLPQSSLPRYWPGNQKSYFYTILWLILVSSVPLRCHCEFSQPVYMLCYVSTVKPVFSNHPMVQPIVVL